MRHLPFTRDWRFKTGIVAAVVSLIGLALVPSQVLEPKFGARSIAFSPKTMPAVALALMALLGVVMALGPVLSREERETTPPAGPLRLQVLAAMAIVAAFVAAIDQIGLILATSVSIAVLALLLGNRNIWVVLVLAIVVPGAIWLIFAKGLNIFLPEGRLVGGLF